jgi:DNA-binding transcriptional ArsR family regulator
VSDHDHPVDPDRVQAVRAEGLPVAEAESIAGLSTLLADPLRARLLAALLVAEEVCVGDLALALHASEDAVTYALRLLRTAGLVRRRRDGRMGYYRLRDGAVRDALADALAQLRRLGALHPEAIADDLET